MKFIKKFETFQKLKDLQLNNLDCYLIDNPNFMTILKKIKKTLKPEYIESFNTVLKYLKNDYYKDTNTFIGIYLFFDKTEIVHFAYYGFQSESQKNIIMDSYKNEYTFKGAIELINDELYINTFYWDINKYNL